MDVARKATKASCFDAPISLNTLHLLLLTRWLKTWRHGLKRFACLSIPAGIMPTEPGENDQHLSLTSEIPVSFSGPFHLPGFYKEPPGVTPGRRTRAKAWTFNSKCPSIQPTGFAWSAYGSTPPSPPPAASASASRGSSKFARWEPGEVSAAKATGHFRRIPRRHGATNYDTCIWCMRAETHTDVHAFLPIQIHIHLYKYIYIYVHLLIYRATHLPKAELLSFGFPHFGPFEWRGKHM